MDGAEILARIDILRLNSETAPGVKLTALQEFMDMTPVQRAVMIGAVVQLCGAAIDAIISDNPDDAEVIREVLDNLSIEPSDKTTLN
jgi:hypothetical protein